MVSSKNDLDKVEQLGRILEKSSSPNNLSESLRCLSNPYHKNSGRDDIIFDLFKLPGTNEASVGKLITVLKGLGLRRDDPRLKEMMSRVRTFTKMEEELNHETKDPNHWKLSREQFCECISPSTELISQALQNNLVIPCWPVFTEKIRDIYLKCKLIKDGQCAQYIPQLARETPKSSEYRYVLSMGSGPPGAIPRSPSASSPSPRRSPTP
ncbi:unnamed protein product, partial [Mesorhabditis spiculigera]